MLSRLKGIETGAVKVIEKSFRSLDMLSRLKGIETLNIRLNVNGTLVSLDMLSRLKGIETLYWFSRARRSFP